MNAYVLIYETWLNDKNRYDYVNMCVFTNKEAAKREAERRNAALPDDLSSCDSYFVDTLGLFSE